MAHEEKTAQVPVTLSRTLGIKEVTLLGVGALLGGGVFTLLGHVAGFAGGGLVFSMLLGSFIAFLNLNSYVSLATTFPEAGGGYKWVREGLGDLNGFLSGWCSWMAHSVACALYAVSFGFFANEFLFSFLRFPVIFFTRDTWGLVFAVAVIIIFGFVNGRGVGFSTRTGGIFAVSILVILLGYIIFGTKHLFDMPFEKISQNFSPLLPFGVVGILQASALFYIAFEGSEIQAQSGEEVKDPGRTLKIGLFASWAIISLLYLLIAFIVIAATENGSLPSWQFLGKNAEGAIIESAKQFMPWGYFFMILGGLIANIGALNATIYSSSRVLFAMARDNFVWGKIGVIDPKTRIPHFALLLSVLVIITVALFLPLKDIASAADILFILLFVQINAAYIQLRRKRPDARWRYIIPLGIVVPVLAICLYVAIGIALFNVSPVAIYLTLIWFLLGLVNYLGYTKTTGKEMMEKEVKYEHTTRFRQKFGYRIILPIAEESHADDKSEIALAMAKTEGGEILALRIHEVPASLPLDARFNTSHEKRILDFVEQKAVNEHFNIYTRLLAARSIPDAILDTVEMEDGDLLVMGWDGYVNTKGFIFGKKIDAVLHRIKCDLIVTKLESPLKTTKKIFIPISIEDNPNLRFTGRVADALITRFGAEVTVGMVVPKKMSLLKHAEYKNSMDRHVREIKLKTLENPETKIIRSDLVISAILKEGERYDVILLPADRGRITRTIGMGSIPEQVAKHAKQTVIMAKGHRGIVQPFFDYLQSRF